jgi:hypothetical protein
VNLYLTVAGRYVGTQAEAKKSGKGWTPETVPTDKEGLIEYLNQTVEGRRECELRDFVGPATLEELAEQIDEPTVGADPFPVNPLTAAPEMRWKRQEPRLFSAGPDNDAICEAIEAATGNALARIGEAYVCRVAEITKGIDR